MRIQFALERKQFVCGVEREGDSVESADHICNLLQDEQLI